MGSVFSYNYVMEIKRQKHAAYYTNSILRTILTFVRILGINYNIEMKKKIQILVMGLILAICGFSFMICCFVNECRPSNCFCPQTGSFRTITSHNRENAKVPIQKSSINYSLKILADRSCSISNNYAIYNCDFSSFHTPLETIILLA